MGYLTLPQVIQIKRHVKQPLTHKGHRNGLPGTSTGLTNKETKTREATFNTDGKQQIWQQYKKKIYIEMLLGTMNFPVIPKGIKVQEGLSAGGTCQPHPQMVYVHVCTDDNTWGWWPLTAPLYLVYVHPLIPPTAGKGVQCGQGWPPPKLGKQLRRELPTPVQPPSHRNRSFGFSSFRLLRGWLGYGGGRSRVASFGWGWGGGHGEVWYGSPQEPIQTLYLWSCHCWLDLLLPIHL